jgi:hypothetical protein
MSGRTRYFFAPVMMAVLMVGLSTFSGLAVRAAAGLGVDQLGQRAVHSQPGRAATVAWVRQFGSPQHDAATGITVDPQGNVFVGGWTDGALPAQSSAGARDAFVRKYTGDGTEMWTRQFGTAQADVAMDVATTRDGDVYVVGQTNGTLPGQPRAGESDAYVRKYGGTGAELWTRQFGGGRASAAANVLVLPSEAVLVTGWVYGSLPGQASAGQYDAFARLYRRDGDEQRTRQFGTPVHDRAGRPVPDAAANIDLPVQSQGNRRSVAVRKLDPNGNDIQESALQTSDIHTEVVYGVAGDRRGDLYVVGLTDTDHGHAFLRKYDSRLNLIWMRELHITGTEDVVAVDVAADPDGNAYVAGQTPAGNRWDAFVRKYTANGTEVWTQIFATGADTIPSQLVADPSQNVYLAGRTRGIIPSQTAVGLSDAFVAKLR